MHVFLISGKEGNKLLLNEEESWHCSKVLRMEVGEMVYLLDGKGMQYVAELEQVHEKNCVAAIKQSITIQKRSRYLHLAVAPTKNMDRMEWMVEKVTELGIEEISLITCKNSERKHMNAERLRRVMLSSVKQSRQAYLPTINDTLSLSQFLEKIQVVNGKKLIAHCHHSADKITLTANETNPVILLIGPEGDFTTQEVELALRQSFMPVSLGESRLRTETAGIYAAAFFR